LSFLRKIAGSTLVKIEPVDEDRDQFGTGSKRKIVKLSRFLDMLDDPKLAGKWYMTTQYEEEEEEEEEEDDNDDDLDDDGNSFSGEHKGLRAANGDHVQENLFEKNDSEEEQVKIDERLLPKMEVDVTLPPPTDAMAHLFPLPGPDIMGNLVLQQCNLWMGNGISGKSSGLHHDFHDNLYMLVSIVQMLRHSGLLELYTDQQDNPHCSFRDASAF
jgi:hypothetical protein